MVLGGGCTDPELDAQRSRELLGEVGADRSSINSPDQLADKPAEQRVTDFGKELERVSVTSSPPSNDIPASALEPKNTFKP